MRNEGHDKIITDQGGLTKWGISQKAYPNLDIKNLTFEDAKRIYKNDYWLPIQGDKINSQKVANIIFDMAINAGAPRATKLAQAVGRMANPSLLLDGRFGAMTLNAINKINPADFIRQYTNKRIEFYKSLAQKDPATHGGSLRGWLIRANSYLKDLPNPSTNLLLLGIGFFIAWRLLK